MNGKIVLSNEQVEQAFKAFGANFVYDCVTQEDLSRRLMALENIIEKNITLEKQNRILLNRLDQLEDIVRPDETDVHNINRRIEVLMQRIDTLEDEKVRRGWPPW